MEESEIKAIKLILAVLALGLLVAVGAAFEDYGGSHHHGGPSDGYHDFGGFYDWLSPGAYYYSYSYYPTYTYYPTYYYPTYYYPTYTPVYTYTAPVVYDPVVYDPWWAANVYGLGATTYYYTNNWSWSSYRSGFYFR